MSSLHLKPYFRSDKKFPHNTNAYGGQSEYPNKRVWSFSNTLGESSQTSDKKTIIESIDSCTWLSAMEDLQLNSFGPPK